MTADPPERRWTVGEFLTWDDGTDRRYELVDGKVVEIAVQPEAHGAILANLAGLLHDGLERPCQVLLRAGVVPPDGRTPTTRPTYWSPAVRRSLDGSIRRTRS